MAPIYHTTTQLLSLVSSLNCPFTYNTFKRNTTDDGLDMVAVTVNADKPEKSAATDKLRVMFTFGIHGREYFASEVAYNFLSTLCDGSDRSAAILKNVAFTIVPVTNPSGRSRTDSDDAAGTRDVYLSEQKCTDRRKNANLVDLNRNFDVAWNLSAGSSGFESDDDYRGPGVMSEVESNTVSALAKEWQPDMYMDLHTGTLAMYMPWNYKDEPVSNPAVAANMSKLLRHVVDAEDASGKSIWDGSAKSVPWRAPDAGLGAEISYIASGTVADYMQTIGVKYTFIWEMYEASDLAWRRNGARLGLGAHIPRKLLPGEKLPRGGGVGLMDKASRAQHAQQISARRRDTSGQAGALLPTGAQEARISSTPSDWTNDECFAYFNPITDDGLAHWLGAWTEALMQLNEQLIVVEGYGS